MFKKKEKKNIENKGFTLVEVLIAISILMISVAAPLSLAASGIQAANLAKQQIVAYYLAQDGYEWVKNRIDTNKLNHWSYAEGGMIHSLEDDCVGAKCKIDTINNAVSVYSDDDYLQFDSSNGIYSYTAGDDSLYKRYIEIKKIEDNGTSVDEVEIIVTIEWNVPYVGVQKYELMGHIGNW